MNVTNKWVHLKHTCLSILQRCISYLINHVLNNEAQLILCTTCKTSLFNGFSQVLGLQGNVSYGIITFLAVSPLSKGRNIAGKNAQVRCKPTCYTQYSICYLQSKENELINSMKLNKHPTLTFSCIRIRCFMRINTIRRINRKIKKLKDQKDLQVL